MLSDTSHSSGKGRSLVLGFHSTAQRSLELLCPVERKKGKCKLYNIECNLRRKIAKEMEGKIRRKAEELYALQSEFTEAWKTPEDAREGNDTTVSSSHDRHQRAYVLQELVQQLKREPEYKNWSLDAAVVEEMTSQGLRQCPHAHKGLLGSIAKNDLQKKTPTTLPRRVLFSPSPEEGVGDAMEQEKEEKDATSVSVVHEKKRRNREGKFASSTSEEEEKNEGRPFQVGTTALLPMEAEKAEMRVVGKKRAPSCFPSPPLPYRVSSLHGRHAYWKVWEDRRRQLFSGLSPVQKVMVCLLWQQCCAVPLRVVCEDVRELLCQCARQQIEAFYACASRVRSHSSSDSTRAGSTSHAKKEQTVKKKVSEGEEKGHTPRVVPHRPHPPSEWVEKEVEDALSRYLESETMEAHVASASSASFFVLHSTSQPLPVGVWNMSFFPSLVCYASGTARVPHSPATLLRSSVSSLTSLFPWVRPTPVLADASSGTHKRPRATHDTEPEGRKLEPTHHGSRTPMDSATHERDGGGSSSPFQVSYPSPLPLLLPITRYYFEGLPPSFSGSAPPSTAACEYQEEEEERQLCSMPIRSALAKYAPLLPTTFTEKELHFSTPSQAEMVMQCVDFLLFVYREEYRCRPPGCCPPMENTEKWRERMSSETTSRGKKEVESTYRLYTHLRYGFPTTEDMFHATFASLHPSNGHCSTPTPPQGKTTTAVPPCVVSSSVTKRERKKKSQEPPTQEEKGKEEEEEEAAVVMMTGGAGLPSSTSSSSSFPTPVCVSSAPSIREEYPFCPSPSTSSVHIRAMHFQHCGMTSADALLSAIVHRPSGIASELMSLDCSHNRLQSLRFLYLIRHNQDGSSSVAAEKRGGGLPQLIRLSLHHNAITQKPDYAEQVRCCVPRLMVLDGKKIRRPPLLLPYPVSSSWTTFAEESLPVGASLPPVASTEDHKESIPRTTVSKKARDTAPPSLPHQGFASSLSREETAMVLDYVERFFSMWETKRIPLTEEEERLDKRQGRRRKETSSSFSFSREATTTTTTTPAAAASSSSSSSTWSLPSQEEWMDEENFPCRYLHPECLFSFAMSSEMKLFDPSVFRLEREVEMEKIDAEEKMRKRELQRAEKKEKKRRKRMKRDAVAMKEEEEEDGNDREADSESEEEETPPSDAPLVASPSSPGSPPKHPTTGVLPISAQDYREGQLFAVSMKNSSRNLLRGRHALEQIGRGSSHCYLAYRSTIYPDGVRVNHHFHSAITSLMKVGATDQHERSSFSFRPRPTRRTTEEESVHYIVQLHGILTWELPSMIPQLSSLPPEIGLTAAYDRTMIFVRRQLPLHGALFERRKGHALVLKADMLQLRPVSSSPPLSSSSSSTGMLSVEERRTLPPPPLTPCVGPVQHLSFARLLPYVLAWGFEGEDRFRVVAVVSEQCGSDAALHAALDILTVRLTHSPPPSFSSSSTVAEGPLAEADSSPSCAIQCSRLLPSATRTHSLPLLYWREESADDEKRREEEENDWQMETEKAKKARQIREAAVQQEVRQLLAKEAAALHSMEADSLPLDHQRSDPLRCRVPPSSISSSFVSPFVLRIVCASPLSGERRGFGPFASPSFLHSRCSSATMQGVENGRLMPPAHPLANSSPTCPSSCPADGSIQISVALLHAIVGIVNQHYVV